MKKKILLILLMFVFMTNAKALSFDTNITNIEDKGNNGTIGSIEKIDLPNKTLNVFFQDIGDEVSFDLTITNSGNRAGILRSIGVTSSGESIEYTNNLPEGGLSINGNDFNTVTITAKVKEGATNGTSSSEIKITYNYDEGSCPDGEILSEDESMCLCPEGLERNETGICVEPEKKIECADDEIYNETKKICEKKVVPTPTPNKPINPSNPKTMDNIILITLLFFVSGLGIYAVMFRRLKTNKKKIVVGAITGVTTLALSFTVLAGVFGLDNLLSAIVNPITKTKEVVVTVNEEIDLIETWDGNCDITDALTPENIFAGGSGTESDPYQVKTAEQLSCLAKSVNEGTTYEGQYIKQTKNIKLNNNLNDQATAGDLSNAHVWTSAGYKFYDSNIGETIVKTFSGTYDGDNKIISGLYLTPESIGQYKGLFGHSTNATFENMVLSDVYIDTAGNTGALVGFGYENLTLSNITTYGNANFSNWDGAGIVSNYDGNSVGSLIVEDTENNINLVCDGSCSGIIHRLEGIKSSPDTPSFLAKNVANNGTINSTNGSSWGGVFGYISSSNANTYFENVGNNGDFILNGTSSLGGISGYASVYKLVVKDCYNTGDWSDNWTGQSGGLFGSTYTNSEIVADGCYNSGNFTHKDSHPEGLASGPYGIMYNGGIFGYTDWHKITITNSYNTGNMSAPYAYGAGILSNNDNSESLVENCYNIGDITGASYTGGIVGYFSGTINKVYNTGTITLFGSVRAGGIVGYGGYPKVYNSYNSGDLNITGERSNQIGGICATECGEIKNSYNTGNITTKYAGTSISGIMSLSSNADIENTYNAGTITFLNEEKPSGDSGAILYAAGIADGSFVENSYNLGDIITYQNGGITAKGFEIGGISVFNGAENSVNTGDITVIVNAPYTSPVSMYIGGIDLWSTTTNCFNAGTITIDDSALDHPVAQDEIDDGWGNIGKHSMYIGQILGQKSTSSSGNKFNTDPNGFAIGCIGLPGWDSCTPELSEQIGTYTTEEAPDILSIINGDDAFEIKEGDTLPTLKVFNE